jgi:hypothetical protein
MRIFEKDGLVYMMFERVHTVIKIYDWAEDAFIETIRDDTPNVKRHDMTMFGSNYIVLWGKDQVNSLNLYEWS